jgi:hypothetical protein
MSCHTPLPKSELYTKKELKHLDVALRELSKINEDIMKIAFKSLPHSLKLEYNYTNWHK